MKNTYPDSLIALAALTQTYSIRKHKNKTAGARVKAGASTINRLTIINTTIGIKFDTTSTRKYFVLIYTTQQNVFVNKTREKYDHFMLPVPIESGIKANSAT